MEGGTAQGVSRHTTEFIWYSLEGFMDGEGGNPQALVYILPYPRKDITMLSRNWLCAVVTYIGYE